MNEYDNGRFEVLNILAAAWHGKEYYFDNGDGNIYSRDSCKNMTLDDAIVEFATKISDY